MLYKIHNDLVDFDSNPYLVAQNSLIFCLHMGFLK